MTTEQHLQAILAKCRELLALAEKRTPGKWDKLRYTYPNRFVVVRTEGADNDAYPGNRAICETITEHPDDAAYIAACAGSAEAGWRSTIAAINGLLPFARSLDEIPNASQVAINAIISEWKDCVGNQSA